MAYSPVNSPSSPACSWPDADIEEMASSIMSASISIVSGQESSRNSFSVVGSDTGSFRSPGMESSQVLSISASTGEEDDEFILLQPRTVRPERDVRSLPSGESESDSDNEEILVPRSPVVSRHVSTTQGLLREDEDSEEDDDEEAARARARALRLQEPFSDDEAHAEDEEAEDDIVLALSIQRLAISSPPTPRASTIHHTLPSSTPTPTLAPVKPASRTRSGTPYKLEDMHQGAHTPTPSNPTLRSTPNAVAITPKLNSKGLTSSQARSAQRARAAARLAQAQKTKAKLEQGGSSSDTSTEPAKPKSKAKTKSKKKFNAKSAPLPCVQTQTSTAYDAAVDYVTRCLAGPPARTMSQRLPFLQALIVEMGLLTPQLNNGLTLPMPTSCTSAKALIRARVHMNARTYVQGRTKEVDVHTVVPNALGQFVNVAAKKEVGVGITELQKMMFPSKAALAASLKNTKRKVPRDWIKNKGLNILMVLTH